MSINSEIERISSSKQDIKNAIESKNVSVPDSAKINEYSTYINKIASLTNCGFNFTANTWSENYSSNGLLDKYKKIFYMPEGVNSESKIVGYVQIPYNSNNFTENELEAFYMWSGIEITDSNIIFYAPNNIDISFSIMVYFN